MGVLFHAPALLEPSHLWMLRMVEELGSEIATLVVDPRSRGYATRAKLVALRLRRPPLWRRALARARILDGFQPSDRIARLAEERGISRVLINYLTHAVRLAPALERIGKPSFVHCHGYDVTWDLRAGDGSRAHAEDYVERVLALPERVRFIANSRATRRRLESIGIAPARIAEKPYGVEVAKTPARTGAGGPSRILYLGRLVDFKGPDLALRAFDRACELGLRGRLVMAGDGPLRAACQELRARSPHRERIELVGAVDRRAGQRLREQADVFTAHNCRGERSGQEEAFGVSLAEAMAAGLPVVSGRNGSVPELVEDGAQGLLFEPRDVESHARALLRLERDAELRARLGRQAWRRARERFSVERERRELRSILGLV